MSVSHFVLCVDCAVRGPDVGDFGTLGWPSLEPGLHDTGRTAAEGDYEEDDEEVEDSTYLTFGTLYQALEAVSLLPEEVEAMAAFLRAHEGHEVVQFTDFEDDGAEYGNIRSKEFRFRDNRFVAANWRVACVETGEVFEAPYDRYRPFESRELTSDEVVAFVDGARQVLAEGSCHHATASIDPHDVLAPLVAYFERNAGGTRRRLFRSDVPRTFRIDLVEEVEVSRVPKA